MVKFHVAARDGKGISSSSPEKVCGCNFLQTRHRQLCLNTRNTPPARALQRSCELSSCIVLIPILNIPDWPSWRVYLPWTRSIRESLRRDTIFGSQEHPAMMRSWNPAMDVRWCSRRSCTSRDESSARPGQLLRVSRLHDISRCACSQLPSARWHRGVSSCPRAADISHWSVSLRCFRQTAQP